jgi:hypothetical protein
MTIKLMLGKMRFRGKPFKEFRSRLVLDIQEVDDMLERFCIKLIACNLVFLYAAWYL